MNSEGQALDLCNANTKPGIDNIAHISEEIIPRNSLHLMDGDAGKHAGDAETLGDNALTRVTDCRVGDEDNHGKKGIEELCPQKNNGLTVAPAAVYPGPDCRPNGSEQQKSSKEKSMVDDGDMDIGVDLSLDESGVLESEPCGTTLSEGSASGCTAANSLTSDTDANKDVQKPSEAGDCMPLILTAVEAHTLSPAQEEGAGHKHGAKRVTFPSDEEIVSGSVEPKDPWRHGRFIKYIAYHAVVVHLTLPSVVFL